MRITRIVVLSLFMLGAAVVTSSGAALGAPLHTGSAARTEAAAKPAVHVAAAAINCEPGNFCDYILPSFGGTCYITSENQPNLAGCRNRDESVANAYPGSVRLYYGFSFAGAWVCINANTQFSSLSGYKFNNGSGKAGYGAPVEDDVSSVTFASGKCSNPI
jgi:peptidase inhibitor family I36